MLMTERELYFDIHEQKWVLCHDKAWLRKEIEDIPLVFIMECENGYYIWCKKHTKYEKIISNDGIEWHTEKCSMQGFPVCFPHQDNKKSKIEAEYFECKGLNNETKIPVRWRLRSDDKTSTLYIGVDICDMLFYDNFLGAVTRIRKFMYGITSYELLSEERKYFQQTLPYPKSVVFHAIDMLSDLARNIYGIKPNVPAEKILNEHSIIAFMFRPFDINCYELTSYVHISEHVPKDCKNAYYILCEKLGISPPKGMKKIYHNNPFSLPMFRALIELGFCDYNLMRLFFDDTKIGRINFKKVDKYDFPFWDDTDYDAIYEEKRIREAERNNSNYHSDMISQEEIDALLTGSYYDSIERRKEYRDWTKLKFIVNWMLEEKGEMVTAWRLHKYTKNGPKQWQIDVANMIFQYFDNLSDKVKQEFLDKGFTISVHDNLVYEINHLDFVRREIIYYPDEEDLECEINGYRFEFPRYTDEFADIGREMNNCVASYIPRDTYYKPSLIVAVRKDGHCVACIEIESSTYKILQALGVNNEKLSGDVLIAVNIWGKKMLLPDSTHQLYNNMPHSYDTNNVVCKNISGRKTYFIYSLNELLSMTEEERGHGFYRALTTKFVSVEFAKRKTISTTLNEIPGKDERKYIHKVCPQLDCVIEAAINGVTEAQIAMSKLYQEYLPYNLVRSQYWSIKCDRRDFQKLLRVVSAKEDI